MPPVIFAVSNDSSNHRPEAYKTITLPMFAAMKPAPRLSFIELEAGTHLYMTPQPDLPMGVAPAVVGLWFDAIMNGYYLPAHASRTESRAGERPPKN
jgi:hypothetical protein